MNIGFFFIPILIAITFAKAISGKVVDKVDLRFHLQNGDEIHLLNYLEGSTGEKLQKVEWVVKVNTLIDMKVNPVYES